LEVSKKCLLLKYSQRKPYGFSNSYNLVDRGIKVINSGNVEVDLHRISSVENDHIGAMRQAMEHLYSLGHRHIAYISGLGKDMLYDLRCLGYRKMIDELKLSDGDNLLIDSKYSFKTGIEAGYQAGEKLISLKKKFTAVICMNDIMAIGLMRCLKDRGYKVPQDVSVMGFDGIELGQYFSPSLTTMALNQMEFGRKIFEMLYTDIEKGIVSYYQNKLILIKRESTAECTK
jgi:DNA-binding LacI/PurR family transcriptional regulator